MIRSNIQVSFARFWMLAQ